MKKLLLIGIDSLEPELLVKFEDVLPNFTRLRQLSTPMELTSVFPVDSIPAWSSIYTGWNPARHGIVKTFDIFDSDLGDILSIDANIFKGRSFWDYAVSSGKKTCVLFPLLAFPPWDVNGVMVSRSLVETRIEGEPEWLVSREIQACPQSITANYDLPIKGVFGKHPGVKNLRKFAEDGKQALISEADLGLKLSQDYDWDLFFICPTFLDIIQHRLWRFCDENDPSYPGTNAYQDIIKEYYQLLDKLVGQFMELHPEATIIVFSDHGHGIRPTKTVNLNEVLRQNGLLFSKAGKYNPLPYLMEGVKNNLLNLTRRIGLDNWLVNFATKTKRLSSLSKNIYMSTAYLDRHKTVAHLSSFAGVKSYSHGGVEIDRHNLNNRNYEEVRALIIEVLSELKEPHGGEKLVDWVCRREELYQGTRVAQAYPDIVFELKEGFGTGWGIHTPLIGTAHDHNLAPGGHKKKAVFLLSNLDRKPARYEMTLMDIAPTVLDILGIEGDFDFDGRSIFRD